MIKISVIVPCYNAEKYINSCLDSILNQTFKDFEIIAVNDGSKDNTLSILEGYQNAHPEIIKVLNQENQGLSITRNKAIEIACGEYLIFVDSDDYIKPDMLELLYNKATAGNYDVVASDVDCVYPDRTVLIKSGVTFETNELSLEQKKSLFFGVYPIVGNKIFKREIFNDKNLCFEKGLWFEDVLFLHKLIPNLKSIGYIDKSFYQYIQNPGSITYTYSDKLNDINIVVNKILEYYRANNIFEEYKDELEYMYARYMLATYIKRLSKAKSIKILKRGIAFALAELHREFPDFRKNKYIKNSGLKGWYLRYFNSVFAYMIYFIERNRMN